MTGVPKIANFVAAQRNMRWVKKKNTCFRVAAEEVVVAFSKRIKFPWRFHCCGLVEHYNPSWFRFDWFHRFYCLCRPASCRIRVPPVIMTNGLIPVSACTSSSSSKGTTVKTDGDLAIITDRPADIRRPEEDNRARARVPKPILVMFSTNPTATDTITPCPGRRCTTWCIKNVS